MNVYIKHRFLLLLPVLLGITFFTFVLMQLPADDTVDMMYKASGAVSETVKAAARAELGLDRPLLVRYLDWLLAVCSGDMGRSYISGTPVTALFVAKLQPTLYLTALALLPAVICVLCDWRINGGILWSGYASGGILLLYVLTVLPLWFKRPNPVIFVPLDFAAIILYLLYIDLATGGHWFLTFAFPVAGSIGVLITTVVALLRYVRRGYLYIFGGALIAAGGLAMLLEFLLNLTFGVHQTFFWSFYPLAAGVLLGVMLIIIAVCPPLRRSLHRKFFL